MRRIISIFFIQLQFAACRKTTDCMTSAMTIVNCDNPQLYR